MPRGQIQSERPLTPPATGESRRREQLIDPEILISIRNLEFRARIVVDGFWNGLHRSPVHGFSVEFSEYRPYVPGDDLRYLDWRLLARTDRYYLKKFEDETNLRCHILSDASRSMSYGSTGYSKSDYANTLAAALAWFLYAQGDAVGVLTFDENIREYLPARHRTGHLRQVMVALERPPGGRSTNLSAPLRRITEIVRKRSLMILISDLIAPLDRLEQDLTTLAASGHEVLVFQILDPKEVDFDFNEPRMFHDVESGRDLFIDPGNARRGYLRQFEAHCQAVEQVCQAVGAGFSRFTSDQPLELVLYDFLRERMQRTKTIQRRSGATA